MWRCKRTNLEVFWDSGDKEGWNKYQRTGEKHFPVCNKWSNGRCLEDKRPCEKGGKHYIEKISD